jgi:hypothetical protein
MARQFDFVTHDVQGAALLQARRGVVILEVHRHGDLDRLVLVDAVQVEVHRLVGDGMHVDGLGDDRLGFLAVLQGHQVAQQLAGVERLAELVALHRDGDRILVAAVQHAGNQARAAGFARAARAGALADFNVQDDIGHGLASKRSRRAKTRAATERPVRAERCA